MLRYTLLGYTIGCTHVKHRLWGEAKVFGVDIEEFGREASPSLPSTENLDQELPPLSISHFL